MVCQSCIVIQNVLSRVNDREQLQAQCWYKSDLKWKQTTFPPPCIFLVVFLSGVGAAVGGKDSLMKADRNGGSPVCLHFAMGDFVPGDRQNFIVKARFIGDQRGSIIS